MTVCYALYDTRRKCYLGNVGYYGNELNVKCFATKKDAENYLKVYICSGNYKPRKMVVA